MCWWDWGSCQVLQSLTNNIQSRPQLLHPPPLYMRGQNLWTQVLELPPLCCASHQARQYVAATSQCHVQLWWPGKRHLRLLIWLITGNVVSQDLFVCLTLDELRGQTAWTTTVTGNRTPSEPEFLQLLVQIRIVIGKYSLIFISFFAFVLWRSLDWPKVPDYHLFITLADGQSWKTRESVHGLIQRLHGNLSHHAQYSKNCQGTHCTSNTSTAKIHTCAHKWGMWVRALKELILQKWKCLWNYMCVCFTFLLKENECLKKEILEKNSCIEKQSGKISELITQNQRWDTKCLLVIT